MATTWLETQIQASHAQKHSLEFIQAVGVFPTLAVFGFPQINTYRYNAVVFHDCRINIILNGTMEPEIWFHGTSLWVLQWQVLPKHCKFFTCGDLQFTDLTYAFVWTGEVIWSPRNTIWTNSIKSSKHACIPFFDRIDLLLNQDTTCSQSLG